jgi:4-amino-4-deoxy-L-arabinose transferase-like glycosyltransferase
MRIKTAVKKSITRQEIVCLSILLTITLCIGIYLIATTVIISKDGVTFISYARNFGIDPTQTMLKEEQHPGYPVIIFLAHKILDFFGGRKSVFDWIYSAQIMTLIFRLFTVTVLYFIGKDLVGGEFSFWAILILVLLPKPAHYGSDVLSDWPHIFFLTAGMLLLMRGAVGGKWWLFGFAGISAGVGYLIRPECAQIVVYGSLWLVGQLFCLKRISSRPKTVIALSLLLVGFFVVAWPYMQLKGAVFPKKQVGKFAVNTQPAIIPPSQRLFASDTANIMPSGIAGALRRLFENIGDTLMWFFVPALLFGLHRSFRKVNWYEGKQFFIIVFAVLNIFLMIWLYNKTGYMSVRHSLPLIVFTIFYIPVGLQVCASWLQNRFPIEI